jgi:oxalate---CoA ligase
MELRNGFSLANKTRIAALDRNGTLPAGVRGYAVGWLLGRISVEEAIWHARRSSHDIMSGRAGMVNSKMAPRGTFAASPINPADKTPEMRLFITAGQAKAVIREGNNVAAGEVAQALSLPIWTPQVDQSGLITLPQVSASTSRSAEVPEPEDVALLMYTSGSTGHPKAVLLTQRNVVCSASNIAVHYALAPEDRSLVVMPLFHGHGLIGAALSTLASGGTLIVPPRFSASGFWPLFREHQDTWYTAVPTIHQVLLMRADTNAALDHGARFIRSCSAALAPAVLANLEKRFGAPVIEAYGMTEASHRVASNPRPPHPRKLGTVGFGTSVEIAIAYENGTQLGLNAEGESDSSQTHCDEGLPSQS